MLLLALFLSQIAGSFACVSHTTIRTAVAALGDPTGSGVLGYVQFQQNGPDCNATVTVALQNLPIEAAPFPYHIHVSPLTQRNTNCSLAGPHWDPANRETTLPYVCDPADPFNTCSIGDLSGKHGKLPNSTNWISYEDSMVQLYGEYSIIGRSVVVHRNDSSRYLCATINLISDLSIASATATISTENITGTVNIKQLAGDNTTESTITLNFFSDDGSDTTNHAWSINTLPLDPTSTCAYTGSTYNPYNADPANCFPVYSSHKNCAVGDLSGKLGLLTISPKQTNTTVLQDANLPLSGTANIIGKSLNLFGDTGDEGTILGCSNFNSDVDCHSRGVIVSAYFNDPEVSGVVQFSQPALGCPTTVTVSLSGSGISNNKYHVHKYPTYMAEFAGGHHDPFNRETDPNYASQCSTATPEGCSIGDLSGKFGRIPAPATTYTYTDRNLPLFGIYSIVGRSVVVHKSQTNEVWRSSPINMEALTIENKFVSMSQLIANFPSTIDIEGYVGFGNVTASGNAYIYGLVRHTYFTTAQEYQIKIHTNPATNENCTDLGDVINPTGVSGVGCSATQQAYCAAGDLSGKFGTVVLNALNETSFFFADTSLKLPDILGRSVAFHSTQDNSIVACYNIEVPSSPSPSPYIPSPSPSTIPNPKTETKSSAGGKIAIITLVPMLVVLTGFGFYLWVTQSRVPANIGVYFSPAGLIMWLVSLVAFALGLHAASFSDKGVTPFDHTYTQIVIGFNIVAWVWTTSAVCYEYVQNFSLPTMVMFSAEGAIALFSFCTSIALMAHFDGERDYCAYALADKSKCTIYQGSIFFTWTLFFVTCCKLFMTLRRTGEPINNPAIRAKLSPVMDFEEDNDGAGSSSRNKTAQPVSSVVQVEPSAPREPTSEPSAPLMSTDQESAN